MTAAAHGRRRRQVREISKGRRAGQRNSRQESALEKSPAAGCTKGGWLLFSTITPHALPGSRRRIHST